jgi:hypothetical protein
VAVGEVLAPCSCDVVVVGGVLEPYRSTTVGAVGSLLTSPCFRRGLRAAVVMEHVGCHHYLFTGASQMGRRSCSLYPELARGRVMMAPPCDVVGPSPRSGEVVTPLRSRLSPSPGVGRGGDRLPRSSLSPSPRVGRGGDRLPRLRLSPSPGVGRGRVRLPESRLSPSPGVGRGGASYGARGWTWLLSASPWRVAQQSEQGRRRCFPIRSVSGAAK